MPFTEDLSVFFNTAEFATACTYKAGGVGVGTTINVIFDAAFIEHLGITGTNPVILAKASDVSSFSNADTFTINGVTYRGVNDEPRDDGAIVTIQLQKTT